MHKKLFSAEIKQFSHDGAALSIPSEGMNDAQYHEIMTVLNQLKEQVCPAEEIEVADATSQENHSAELEKLRTELQELSDVILETRREIASLQSPSGQKLNTMTDQLDAVVGDTETATNSILEAVESIEDKAESMELNASSPEETECLEGIAQAVMKIYEACNFQDVTGQRISKVVTTLSFVDERINKMIEILGGEDQLGDIEVVELQARFDGDVELSGPRVEGHEISQDEIDSLFD